MAKINSTSLFSNSGLHSANMKVLLFALVLLAIGCGGSPSSTPGTPVKPLDPQGNWLFSFTSTQHDFQIAGQLFELQSPVVTSGGLGPVIPPAGFTACNGSFTFNGQASGTNSITFTVQQSLAPVPLVQFTLTGTIADDQAHMSGTWTVNNPGCLNAGETGSWTAQLLAPVTGNWSGIMSDASSNINVSAALVENVDQTSSAMGHVTGSFSLSGSPCFASTEVITMTEANNEGNFQTFHAGENFLYNTAPNADGISVTGGGTVSPDGTSFVSSFGFTLHGGLCDGQEFEGSLTHQ